MSEYDYPARPSVPRFRLALETGHRLAERHVEVQQGQPDKGAWYRHWDAFVAKAAGKWTNLELRCIHGYAWAALAYHLPHPEGRGLWREDRWNNLRGDEPKEAA